MLSTDTRQLKMRVFDSILPLLLIFIQLDIKPVVEANEISIDKTLLEAKIHDPVVWDPNSLYKKVDTHQMVRRKRSTSSDHREQQVVDACQSKVEILTPYYANNSKGKLRTIVNSELMQQAVQVETCVR